MTIHLRELINRSLDDELSYVESRTLRAHLADCAECAALAADLRRADALLSGPDPRLPVPPFDAQRLRRGQLGWVGIATAAVFVLLVLAIVGATRDAAVVGSPASPSGTPAVLPTSPIPASATPERSFTPGPSTASPESRCSVAAVGSISVCPKMVPVGGLITIAVGACSNAGEPTVLFFGTAEQFGQPTQGTYGEAGLGSVGPSSGSSRVTLAVPSAVGAIDGRGGGPVRPGLYAVYSKPDLCRTYVSVQ
jgi:hypothetical protein